MQQLLKTQIGRLRMLAFIEGTSFLVLLFITMPLKYGLGYPEPNYVFGMLHGIFFLLYIFAVLQAKIQLKWTYKITALALIASVVPFGTFWADRKIFQVRY